MKAKGLLTFLLVAGFVLALCSSGLAEDIVRLSSGQELRGEIIKETDDYIVLRGKYGEQEISRDNIESIEYGFDFDKEFKKRSSRLEGGDSEGWYELGLFCGENNQPEKAKECFQKAVAADSDNGAARDKLGHKKYKGKWYEKEEEYYKARGWVLFGGVWMAPEDMDKYKAGLVKREDGTWVSKKTWDNEEKKRKEERLKRKEKERKEKEARGEKVEEDPAEDESGDAGAAIRRKNFGKKSPVPVDKAERKKWIKSYKKRLGWQRHVEAKYYIFMSNAPQEKIVYYAKLMDKMCKNYIRIFAYKEEIKIPFLVHMYANQQEFMRKDHKGANVGGYYDGSKIVCFLAESARLSTQVVLFHEGTHQFQGIIWPNMLGLTRVPGGIWMVEGLATYFECAEMSGGKLATGQINKLRHGTLKQAMTTNRYTKLPELIRMVQRGYSAFHYAHGWGLVHYLIHASKKHMKRFKEYFKEFRKEGVKPVEAFGKHFPIDENKLDEDWKRYITSIST